MMFTLFICGPATFIASNSVLGTRFPQRKASINLILYHNLIDMINIIIIFQTRVVPL